MQDFNNLGYKNSIQTNNTYYKNLFILNEGANLVLQKRYETAIDSISKALPFLIKNEDYGNTLAGYYYLGKAYQGLHNSELAVKNFKRVDSINDRYNEIIFEFCDGYSYLIDYYKRNGDSKNQLIFSTKKIQIDSILNSNYKELSNKIKNEFETPNLVQEKEQEVNFVYTIVYVLLLIFIPLIIFIVYKKHKQKKGYEAKIDSLVQAYEDNNFTTVSSVEITDEDNSEQKLESVKKININPDTFKEIEEQLKRFEKQKEFLLPNINTTTLAIKFNTNYKYLSEVIRITKNKSFTQYVNDLRIEEGLKKIQSDKKILLYNNDAIALEFGFNNYKTFKKAFFNSTQVEFRDFATKILNSDNQ